MFRDWEDRVAFTTLLLVQKRCQGAQTPKEIKKLPPQSSEPNSYSTRQTKFLLCAMGTLRLQWIWLYSLCSWKYLLSTCGLGPLVTNKKSLLMYEHLLFINSTLSSFVWKHYVYWTYYRLKLCFYLCSFCLPLPTKYMFHENKDLVSVLPRIVSPVYNAWYTVDTQYIFGRWTDGWWTDGDKVKAL